MTREVVCAALLLLAASPASFAQKDKDEPEEAPFTTQAEEDEKWTRYLAVKPEPGAESLPPALAGALQPVELPEGGDAWAVQVMTRGGFTGLGRGDVTVNSAGAVTCTPAAGPCPASLSAAALESLAKVVAAAEPARWKGPGVGACRDCYVTLLALRRREKSGGLKTYTVYWDDITSAKLPAEVARLYLEALKLTAPGR